MAIFFVPGLVWYICKVISERLAEPTEVPTDKEYEHGYIGLGSDLTARKNLSTGLVEFKFHWNDVWRRAEYLAETFRTEKQF